MSNQPPFPGFLTPEQQQQMASQAVHNAYDPILELYRKQQDRQRLASLGEQAGLAKLYDVLGGSLAGFSGQVQDAYNQAGNALTNPQFSQGYDHGWQIAQQGLKDQGTGYGLSAAALPAISGQEGGIKYLTAYQQGKEADQKLQDLIDSTAAEIPGKTQEFLASIQQDQSKLQYGYATLQQKEAAAAAKAGQADRAYAWSVADRFTKNSSHFYVAKPTAGGGWQVVDAGPKAQKQQAGRVVSTDAGTFLINPATGATIRKLGGPKLVKTSIGGYIYERDANGNWNQVGGPGPKPPAPAKPVFRTNSRGQIVRVTPGGVSVVPGANPAKPPPKLLTPAAFQRAKAKGNQILLSSQKPGFTLNTDPSTPLTVNQLRGIVADANKRIVATAKARGKKNPTLLTLAHLASATPDQLAQIGLVHYKPNPQAIYLQLIGLGLSVKQAVAMMKRFYPDFGAGYTGGSTPDTSSL